MKVQRLIKVIASALLISLSLSYSCFAEFTPITGVKWLVDTPPENVFRVEGDDRTFVLLDTTNNNDSKFFIITKEYYAKRPFDQSGISLFDPTDKNNLGGWLNGAFLTNGSVMHGGAVYKFPKGIIDHINRNHIWITDGEYAATTTLGSYGVGLMSQEEIVKYKDKFGINDGLTTSDLFRTVAGWWLRSQDDLGSNSKVALRMDMGEVGTVSYWTSTSDNSIATRPCFYLDRDFFKEVRIAEDMGFNVRAAIKRNYSKEELMGMYTKEEVQDIFGYDADINISVKSMTDSNGEKINNFLEADQIITTVSAKSLIEGENTVILMQVLYGEDNCPITFVSGLVELPFDEEKDIKVDIRLTPRQREKGAYLKTYLRKPGVGMKVLSNAVRTYLNQ